MAVRHVPVRHRETREERLLPETALRHFPDWEPIDPETGEPLTDTGEPQLAESDAGAAEPGDETTASKTTRKGRASAKDTKE